MCLRLLRHGSRTDEDGTRVGGREGGWWIWFAQVLETDAMKPTLALLRCARVSRRRSRERSKTHPLIATSYVASSTLPVLSSLRFQPLLPPLQCSVHKFCGLCSELRAAQMIALLLNPSPRTSTSRRRRRIASVAVACAAAKPKGLQLAVRVRGALLQQRDQRFKHRPRCLLLIKLVIVPAAVAHTHTHDAVRKVAIPQKERGVA